MRLKLKAFYLNYRLSNIETSICIPYRLKGLLNFRRYLRAQLQSDLRSVNVFEYFLRRLRLLILLLSTLLYTGSRERDDLLDETVTGN